MTPVTKTALGIAAALLLAAGLGAGAANAAPTTSLPTSVAADAEAGVALASGRVCYPRLRWTYRPGHGPIQVVVGWICIPYLVRPPFRVPTPPERIGPRVVLH
jgi:hypothetical protein